MWSCCSYWSSCPLCKCQISLHIQPPADVLSEDKQRTELFSRSSSSLPCKAQDWLMFTIPTHFRSTATGKQMSRTIFTRAQKHGYTSEGVQSYVYKYQVQSSVALYRYWQPIILHHQLGGDWNTHLWRCWQIWLRM